MTSGGQPRPSSALRKQQHTKASYASNIKIKNNQQYEPLRQTASQSAVSTSVDQIKNIASQQSFNSGAMLFAEPKKTIHHNQHNVIVQIVDMKDQKKRKKQLSQLFYG
jgi:hypothetical protein